MRTFPDASVTRCQFTCSCENPSLVTGLREHAGPHPFCAGEWRGGQLKVGEMSRKMSKKTYPGEGRPEKRTCLGQPECQGLLDYAGLHPPELLGEFPLHPRVILLGVSSLQRLAVVGAGFKERLRAIAEPGSGRSQWGGGEGNIRGKLGFCFY